MSRYAMLILPSANRVYSGASVELTAAELAVFSAAVLGGGLSEAKPTELGGVSYLAFESDPLTPRAAAFLANVSGCYALFEIPKGLLRRGKFPPLDRNDNDLTTIKKYQGK